MSRGRGCRTYGRYCRGSKTGIRGLTNEWTVESSRFIFCRSRPKAVIQKDRAIRRDSEGTAGWISPSPVSSRRTMQQWVAVQIRISQGDDANVGVQAQKISSKLVHRFFQGCLLRRHGVEVFYRVTAALVSRCCRRRPTALPQNPNALKPAVNLLSTKKEAASRGAALAALEI